MAKILFVGTHGTDDPTRDKTFDVAGVLEKFLNSGGHLLACGSCLESRHQEAGVCPISTMSELVAMISESDKVVTFG